MPGCCAGLDRCATGTVEVPKLFDVASDVLDAGALVLRDIITSARLCGFDHDLLVITALSAPARADKPRRPRRRLAPTAITASTAVLYDGDWPNHACYGA